MTKVFLTGASGYIGGEVLHTLAAAHPEYEIAALNRDPKKADQITRAYPNVKIVSGSLDDAAILEQEASKADVVLHLAATGHLPSVESIFKGLTSSQRSGPAHWLQISGASLLGAPEIVSKTFGEPSDKIYNDLDGAEEIRAHIRKYKNRVVDNFILDVSGKASGVKTALVPGAIIYGPGRGPVNQRSIQIPELSRIALQRGKAVQVGRGLSIWGNVHVQDLSSLFLLLVEKAVAGDSSKSYWNDDGIYFNSVGNDISFAEISRRVARVAVDKGFIKNEEVEQLSAEDADKLSPHASIVLGTNARVDSRRARQVLGWKPVQRRLQDEIPETLEAEARRLGVTSKA
ncbi:NAD dependent epimerase/dehydratase family protein [Macrophomina phaseolina]|uniref:NAD dependent epimerase/dehydratase family protein n=1 Tax=Macrophomina phaseolina TaxID=35725 RepID=A0ABQ8GIK9_9PEZI|nr:NAD dependent epimerase/dehydratase family protein [Macrophomina phaseolina]